MRKKFFIIVSLILFGSVLVWQDAQSKKIEYEDININQVTDYSLDRIAFLHIENDPDGEPQKKDNSIESLLIIKDNRMILMKSGYDNPDEVHALYQQFKAASFSTEIYPVEKNDIWPAKIKNEPNFMVLTDKRMPIVKKEKKEAAGSNWETYNKLYEVRKDFVNQHVRIFKSLILNQRESNMIVKREVIDYFLPEKNKKSGGTEAGGGGDSKKTIIVYSTQVWAKSFDGNVYYAEDMDGDGIVETFSVKVSDNFHWGNNVTPNVLLISVNTAEAKKDPAKNEYLNTIKDLGKWAVEGLPAGDKDFNEKNYVDGTLSETFPPDPKDPTKKDMRKSLLVNENVIKTINEIYRVHPETQKYAEKK